MASRFREAYLTVYLALVMTVLLSLYLALIEGARSRAIRLEAEIVMDIGLNSILAEYHRELSDRYNLFAVDSSYGTPLAGRGNVEEHLAEYMNRNFSAEGSALSGVFFKDFMGISAEKAEVTQMSILSDNGGEVFRRRAVEAVKDDVGLGLLEDVAAWMETVEVNALRERDVAGEKAQIDRQIQSYEGKEVQISETEWVAAEVQNPTEGLNALRRMGILQSVVEHPEELSIKAISDGELIGARMERGNVSTGNLPMEELTTEEAASEKLFFQEYLMKYMTHYRNPVGSEEDALCYQIEYLIAGDISDVNNLRKVVNQICALREAANAAYLYSDEIKCAEAETLANVIALFMLLPEMAPLLKHALLLGWAYAESVHDVKVLLAGGKVPLLKDSSSWHYELQGALGLEGDAAQYGDTTGLAYEDYLRILLGLAQLDSLTVRAMNIVEANIRLTEGNRHFRLDACYDCVEACVDIVSDRGYKYEITRRKRY